MAQVIVTLRVMPDSPERDLVKLEGAVKKAVQDFGGAIHSTATKPIAFGLSALELVFIMDEAKGSTEPLEKSLAGLKGVGSAEVIDVRRAVG